MKLIIKTNSANTYFVHLPNHVDVDNIERIVEEASWELPAIEEITSYYLNSDGLTNDERKMLDVYGEIKFPMIELNVSAYAGKK